MTFFKAVFICFFSVFHAEKRASIHLIYRIFQIINRSYFQDDFQDDISR